MVNALLLLLAAAPFQQKVEKIKLKFVEPVVLMKRLNVFGQDAQLPNGITQVVADPTDNSIIVKGEPYAIEVFKRLVVAADIEQHVASIPVHNVSAQYMLERLTGTASEPVAGLVPAGVVLSLDDSTNSLVATGPEDAVREARQVVAMFDVRPVQVAFEISGSIVSMHREFSTTAVVANASDWTYSDKSSSTSIRMRSRVNGDGSVTVSLLGTVMGKDVTFSTRLTEHVFAAIQILSKTQLESGVVPTVYTVDERHVQGLNPEHFLKGIENPKPQSAPYSGEVRLVIKAKVKKD